MARKNRPAKKTPVPANPPVLSGNVFATFMHEAQSLGQEVEARRRHDVAVGEYLTQKGLGEDFAAWMMARNATPAR